MKLKFHYFFYEYVTTNILNCTLNYLVLEFKFR